MSAADLAAAYEAFFAEAEAGGFGVPPAGEWTAAQVVAHVALNDGALAEVTEAVLAGEPTRFDNTAVTRAATLDAHVARIGGLPELIAAGREAAARVVALAARLDDRTSAVAVHCHLLDGDTLVVDQPMPWGAMLLGTQASFHLPLHREQLHSLRST